VKEIIQHVEYPALAPQVKKSTQYKYKSTSINQDLVSHPAIQEIAQISKSLNIGLSAIKKAFITQLLRNGIIHIETRKLPATNTFKRQLKLYMKSKT